MPHSRITGTEVELISDPEMFEFFEAGIRGGMVFLNQHHVGANTPRVPQTYNPQTAYCDLLYVDANNLYRQALSMPLPQKGFRWMTPEEINMVDVLTYPVDGPEDCVLEVDLDYPPEVQDHTCVGFPMPEMLFPAHGCRRRKETCQGPTTECRAASHHVC